MYQKAEGCSEQLPRYEARRGRKGKTEKEMKDMKDMLNKARYVQKEGKSDERK